MIHQKDPHQDGINKKKPKKWVFFLFSVIIMYYNKYYKRGINMIIDSFDDGLGMLSPECFYEKADFKADICICFFSHHVKEYIIEKYNPKVYTNLKGANGTFPVYRIERNKENIIFMMLYVGPTSAELLPDLAYVFGVKHFIIFGSCGCLKKEYSKHFIIPTSSYRDEGMSYHYVEPKDYIEIKNHDLVEEAFKETSHDYVKGKVWTTSSIYRETPIQIKKHLNDGCVAVDMEAASMQAVADFYKLNYYTFFFSGDIVASDIWERGRLGGDQEKNVQIPSLDIAFKIADLIKK